MKKQIRRGVFETNSSSTHSVSICDRNKIEYSDIPKNSKIIIDDNYSTGTDIFDELGKLNFVVTMLASIVEVRCDEDEMEIKSFEEIQGFMDTKNAGLEAGKKWSDGFISSFGVGGS